MQSKILWAACVVGVMGIARGAAAGVFTYVGYTVPPNDLPGAVQDPAVVQNTGSTTFFNDATSLNNYDGADESRNFFLNTVLGGNYKYEDFQEVTATTPSPFTAHYTLQFKSQGSPTNSVAGTLSTTDDKAQFTEDKIGSDRGDFAEQQGSTTKKPLIGDLASAIPGIDAPDNTNWYLDTNTSSDPSKGALTVTLNFTTPQTAVGFELNDIVQPGDKAVTVVFSDGASEQITAQSSGPTDKTPNLANNNIWFFGIATTVPSVAISSITIDLGNDPITLDNIYTGTAPPGILVTGAPAGLPSVAMSGMSLLGIAALGHRLRRKAITV